VGAVGAGERFGPEVGVAVVAADFEGDEVVELVVLWRAYGMP
jgi:hypothetical protein